MHLTPDRIAATYDMLRAFPPFSRWKLPPSEEVELRLIPDKESFAWYTKYRRTEEHILGYDSTTPWSMDVLVMFTAHEMIHMRQEINKTVTRAQHNAAFKNSARTVCKIFGWNYHRFMGDLNVPG